MNTFRLRFIAVLIIAVIVQACSGGDPNIESAKLNIRNKDYTAAVASTDRAIAVNSDNHDAYIWKARALGSRAMENNNIDTRLPDYEAMITALNKADALLQASTDPKAMLSILQIEEIRDDAWRLEHATSVNYVSRDTISDQDFARSIAHMKNAIAIYPDSSLSSRALAEIYFLSADLPSAARQMKETVEMIGSTSVAEDYVRLLQFQREAGMENEVLTTMAKAVELFPDNKEIKIEVANTYLSRAEYDNAASTMSELISFEPDNAEYRYVYATLLFEAINNQISSLNDNYTLAFDLRTEFRETARRPTSAANTKRVQAIEKELDVMNDQNTGIGAEINRLGDVVVEQLTRATELEPTTAKYFSLLGSIYDVKANVRFNEGNEQNDLAIADRMQNEAKEIWKKSLPYMEKATELDPDNRDSWATISRIYVRLGMLEQAEKAMERSEQ